MLIPPRCFTCGQILGSKFQKYKKELKKLQKEHSDLEGQTMYMHHQHTDVYSKELIEKLGIHKYCCKAHILGQLELLRKL